MTSWTLTTVGRMPWTQARQVLASYTCAWLDLDGMNIGTPPVEPPITTCLWGWSDGSYIRVRFDDDTAYVGTLRPGDPNEGTDLPVRVTIRATTTRLGTADPELDPRRFELLEIPGTAPVTFVRAV